MNRFALFRSLVLCFFLFSGTAYAQQAKTRDSLPYQKYPTLPAFNIQLTDSTTVYNTYDAPEGKASVVMFFSPDCDHCEMQTDSFLHHMDVLKDVRFYLITPLSLEQVRTFARKLHLERYPNIIIGRDQNMFFPGFYGASYVPFIVAYDRKKKLVKAWEGGVKIPELLEALKK